MYFDIEFPTKENEHICRNRLALNLIECADNFSNTELGFHVDEDAVIIKDASSASKISLHMIVRNDALSV